MVDADLDGLAQRVAQGDVAAFASIVQRTQHRFYRLAARLMGNTADAEDALQEAYVKAYGALQEGRFDGRSSLSTWLYRIVSNTALDASRRRRLRQGSPDTERTTSESASFDGEVSAEAHLTLRELANWLEDLPPEQRLVLILRGVEGLSTSETAEILECSEGAVEQRLIRARTNLQYRRGMS